MPKEVRHCLLLAYELLFTSKIRHSSVGWNPVHRIFKHLEGLGPSLRWDDGVIRSSLMVPLFFRLGYVQRSQKAPILRFGTDSDA